MIIITIRIVILDDSSIAIINIIIDKRGVEPKVFLPQPFTINKNK